MAHKTNLVNEYAFSRFLSSAGPVGTRFFSDTSGTKNANSNLIAVLDCSNMFLLLCEIALASNENYGCGHKMNLANKHAFSRFLLSAVPDNYNTFKTLL